VTPTGKWGQPANRTSGTVTTGDASVTTSVTICGANVCNTITITKGTRSTSGGSILAKVNLPGPGNYKVTWLWHVCATTDVPSGSVNITDCRGKCIPTIDVEPTKTTKEICQGGVTSTVVSVTKAGWVTVVNYNPTLSHTPIDNGCTTVTTEIKVLAIKQVNSVTIYGPNDVRTP
jgi:hypothetical protein